MQVKGRQIGPLHSPYIVAELSANHNGNLDRALDIITAAAEAGADAIKFQLYDPDRLAEDRGGRDKVLAEGPWSGMSLGEIYDRAHTPIDFFEPMIKRATECNLTWFSSVFDLQGLRALEDLGCPAYKISSFDGMNRKLIKGVSMLRRPTIVSCGMISNDAIAQVIQITRYAGGMNNIALLHCVSAYPTRAQDAKLSRVAELRRDHGVPVGYSDHTLGTHVAPAAVALGACIIEKHVTLDRADGGLDASFSIEPHELRVLVEACRDIHHACNGKQDLAPYKKLMVVT